METNPWIGWSFQHKVLILVFTKASFKNYKSFKIEINPDIVTYEYIGDDGTKTVTSIYIKEAKDFDLTKLFESFLDDRTKQKETVLTCITNLRMERYTHKDLFQETTNNDGSLTNYKFILKKSDELYNTFKDICNEDSLINEYCDQLTVSTLTSEADQILANEINKLTKLPIQGKLLVWLKNKSLLTNEDKTIFVNLTTTNRFITELKLTDFKYELSDPTVIKIKEYFQENENCLIILSKFYISSLIKVIQCLQCPGECLIIEGDSVSKDSNQILENMKFFKFSVIIFRGNSRVDDDFLQNLKNHPSKFVLIKLAETQTNLLSINDETVGFKELQLESKQKILNQRITFDSLDVPLNELGSIEFFDQLEDSTWLSQLLSDGKFIVNKRNFPIFNENKYIDRTLILYKNEIHENMFVDSSSDDGTVSEEDCTDYSVTEDKMIELENKLILVSDRQGTGKTNLLSSISNKMKKRNPSRWIEIITLTNHIEELRKIKTLDSIDFVSKNVLKYDLFTSNLFRHQIDMVLMFDAFDEISETDKIIVIELIRNLLKTNVKQIWITERNRSLEDKLSENSYKIYDFMYQERIEYLIYYWTGSRESTDELRTLAGNLMCSIHRYEIEYNLPLVSEMIAEYLVNNYLTMNSNLPKDLSKSKLFGKYVRSKHSQELDEIHQKVAIKFICPEFGEKSNLSENEITVINSIGIVAIHDGEMINFIHHEFAEFYVAQNILNVLSDELSNDERILDFLLIEIIHKLNFRGVKYFLNYLLPSVTLPQITLKKISDRIKALHENNSLEIKDISKQIYEVYIDGIYYPFRNEENIAKIYYESVHLLNLENVEKYRKYLPKINLDSDTDQKFLEKLLDDNLTIIQYNMADIELFYGIIRLDSINILKKIFQSFRKTIEL